MDGMTVSPLMRLERGFQGRPYLVIDCPWCRLFSQRGAACKSCARMRLVAAQLRADREYQARCGEAQMRGERWGILREWVRDRISRLVRSGKA